MLEVRDLSRNFGALQAVNRVSLAVAEGEVRSIIGPNGAGKSTFFNLVTGAVRPSNGTISFQGRDITGLRPESVFRLGIVRSFQVSHLFPRLTVRQNVQLLAYGRARSSGSPIARLLLSRAAVDERITQALARVGLEARGAEMAGNLSHGDRRLVEIAMALAADPCLLLLDEPTAGMSHDETVQTARLLRSLAPHVTIVIVEHDMSVVMTISDKVTVLHRGSVLAEGRPQEVRDNAAVQDVYFGKGK